MVRQRTLVWIAATLLLAVACSPAMATGMTAAGVPGGRGAAQAATATATAVASAAVTPEAPDHCLNCHSDKQQLIDTAKPAEPVVSESTGVG